MAKTTFNAPPHISYIDCTSSDFYIEFSQVSDCLINNDINPGYDSDRTGDFIYSEYSMFMYPKATLGKFYTYDYIHETYRVKKDDNACVRVDNYEYNDYKFNICDFDVIKQTPEVSSHRYDYPRVNYEIDGHPCIGSYYFAVGMLPCYKEENDSYTYENYASVIIKAHDLANLKHPLSSTIKIACNAECASIVQLFSDQIEHYDDGGEDIDYYKQSIYLTLSTTTQIGNIFYSIKNSIGNAEHTGPWKYSSFKDYRRYHSEQGLCSIYNTNRLTFDSYFTIHNAEQNNISYNVQIFPDAVFMCTAPALPKNTSSEYEVVCHGITEHVSCNADYLQLSNKVNLWMYENKTISSSMLPNGKFFPDELSSTNLRNVEGYECLEAFMPETKDFDFVTMYNHQSHSLCIDHLIVTPLDSYYIKEPQLSSMRYRPYGGDFLVNKHVKWHDNGTRSWYDDEQLSHVMTHDYYYYKDDKTYFQDINSSNEEIFTSNYYPNDNQVWLPIYDYRVKYTTILYDPPITDDKGNITRQRNAVRGTIESNADYQFIRRQLNRIYGSNFDGVANTMQNNWLDIRLEYAHAEDFTAMMQRLQNCDLAVMLLLCSGFRKSSYENSRSDGIVVCCKHDTDTSDVNQIADYVNSCPTIDTGFLKWFKKRVKQSVIVAPTSNSGAAMQPEAQDVTDPMIPAISSDSMSSGAVDLETRTRTTVFMSTQLGSCPYWSDYYKLDANGQYIYDIGTSDENQVNSTLKAYFPWSYFIKYLLQADTDGVTYKTSPLNSFKIIDRIDNLSEYNTEIQSRSERSLCIDKAVFALKKNLFQLVKELHDEYINILNPSKVNSDPVLSAKYGNGCEGSMCVFMTDSQPDENRYLSAVMTATTAQNIENDDVLWKSGQYRLGNAFFNDLLYREEEVAPYGGFIDFLYMFLHFPYFLNNAKDLDNSTSTARKQYAETKKQILYWLTSAFGAFAIGLDYQEFNIQKIIEFFSDHGIPLSIENNAGSNSIHLKTLIDRYFNDGQPDNLTNINLIINNMGEFIKCSTLYDNQSNFIENLKIYIANIIFKDPSKILIADSDEKRGIELLFSAIAKFLYRAGEWIAKDTSDEAKIIRDILLVNYVTDQQLTPMLNTSNGSINPMPDDKYWEEYMTGVDTETETEMQLVKNNQYFERIKNIILFVGLRERPHVSVIDSRLTRAANSITQ